MSIEILLGTIAGIGTVTSMLFGGGLFKTALKHSNELAVQKHILTQTELKVEKNDRAIHLLETAQALQERDIAGFKEHIRKLDMLPEISAQLRELQGLMSYMKEQIADFRLERTNHDKHS